MALVAYFKMDECNSNKIVYDYSPAASNGTSNLNTNLMYSASEGRKCFYFPKSSSYHVDINADLVTGTEFTICFYAKFLSSSNNHTVVSSNFDYGNNHGLCVRPTNTAQIGLFLGTNLYSFILYRYPVGQWAHLTISHSGTTSKLYVNGFFYEQRTTKAYTLGVGGENIIGWENTKMMEGYLSELRIYDTQLTDGEINQIYNDLQTDSNEHSIQKDYLDKTIRPKKSTPNSTGWGEQKYGR